MATGNISKEKAAAVDWAAKISAAWRKAVAACFAAGDALIAAKAALKRGEFQRMCEEKLPFDASVAERLMKVARDKRLRKTAHAQHLPASWTTLYELTKLTDERFEAAIKSRAIHPGMRRQDAAALVVVNLQVNVTTTRYVALAAPESAEPKTISVSVSRYAGSHATPVIVPCRLPDGTATVAAHVRRMSIDEARRAYIAAAASLPEEQRIAEVRRILDAFGLSEHFALVN